LPPNTSTDVVSGSLLDVLFQQLRESTSWIQIQNTIDKIRSSLPHSRATSLTLS
jgi:hypothetical protein